MPLQIPDRKLNCYFCVQNVNRKHEHKYVSSHASDISLYQLLITHGNLDVIRCPQFLFGRFDEVEQRAATKKLQINPELNGVSLYVQSNTTTGFPSKYSAEKKVSV